MDLDWAASKLDKFVDLIDAQEQDEAYLRALGNGYQPEDENFDEIQLGQNIDRRERELKVMEPGIMKIMNAAQLRLGDYRDVFDLTDMDGEPVYTYKRRWEPARDAALKALGLHTFGAEVDERMRPTAPDVVADQFHPWVWDAARPMWDAGSIQTAVSHAASSINVRLQQKTERTDISDRKLCAESFSFEAPVSGKSRLRFPGDQSTETWKALQGGASSFGQGCFTAIRNPVAHDHQFPVTKQEALEQLAALSVLARWIDLCSVATV